MIFFLFFFFFPRSNLPFIIFSVLNTLFIHFFDILLHRITFAFAFNFFFNKSALHFRPNLHFLIPPFLFHHISSHIHISR